MAVFLATLNRVGLNTINFTFDLLALESEQKLLLSN
jgi:hypothetical protein